MIADFSGFILECFKMVVKLFQNTVIDGITYEVLIVASCMIGIVLTSLVVRFRLFHSFGISRPPRDPDLR